MYADATIDDAGRAAIAWHSVSRTTTRGGIMHETSSPITAELLALLQAIQVAHNFAGTVIEHVSSPTPVKPPRNAAGVRAEIWW